MNKTIKRYIRDVKKELCCPFTMKIAFISYLEKQIKDLYADTEITIETLYKEFGTPQDIANGLWIMQICLHSERKLFYIEVCLLLQSAF